MEYVQWREMLGAYLFTIAVESAILWFALSRQHPPGRRLFAGVWLSTCTFPILWIALPAAMYPDTPRWLFLLTGEGFVFAAECALFWLAFDRRRSPAGDTLADMLAIIVANLASFLIPECWRWMNP